MTNPSKQQVGDKFTFRFLACVAGVRRGRKEENRAREAREDRTRRSPSRASPSRAHFDFPPFLRPATQAIRFPKTIFQFRRHIQMIIEINFLCWRSNFKHSCFGFHQVSKRSKAIKCSLVVSDVFSRFET